MEDFGKGGDENGEVSARSDDDVDEADGPEVFGGGLVQIGFLTEEVGDTETSFVFGGGEC